MSTMFLYNDIFGLPPHVTSLSNIFFNVPLPMPFSVYATDFNCHCQGPRCAHIVFVQIIDINNDIRWSIDDKEVSCYWLLDRVCNQQDIRFRLSCGPAFAQKFYRVWHWIYLSSFFGVLIFILRSLGCIVTYSKSQPIWYE